MIEKVTGTNKQINKQINHTKLLSLVFSKIHIFIVIIINFCYSEHKARLPNRFSEKKFVSIYHSSLQPVLILFSILSRLVEQFLVFNISHTSELQVQLLLMQVGHYKMLPAVV